MMFSPVALPGNEAAPHETAGNPGSYLDSISLFERLHRLLHDIIKDEFERLGITDLTPVQAMLLYNLGANEVSASELRSRGMYQGSNVSYNLKKLAQMGYVHNIRCELDRRSVRVSLTENGARIQQTILDLFHRQADNLGFSGVLDDPPLPQTNGQLRRIARFWSEQIRYIY